jgi:methionyl-tRNA synthetase
MALPRQVLVHGHWTMNGLKMSKSLGNVISPDQLFQTFHPDVIRYYMIKEGGQERDGNWSNDSLRNRHIYLGNTWGNLISRMMSAGMDLKTAVDAVFTNSGKEYRGKPSHTPAEDEILRKSLDTAIGVYRYNMDKLNLEAALTAVDALLRAVMPFGTLLMEGKSICYVCQAMDLSK